MYVPSIRTHASVCLLIGLIEVDARGTVEEMEGEEGIASFRATHSRDSFHRVTGKCPTYRVASR